MQACGIDCDVIFCFYVIYCSAATAAARNQTTKGMWVAKAVGMEPFTVVMDLEGTDGRERGEVNDFLHANMFDV
jgi:hypothetical protein